MNTQITQTDGTRGIIPIIATPFDSYGDVDFKDLNAELEWLLGKGVDGVGIAVASEVGTLNSAEWLQVVGAVVSVAGGQVPVVVSVGLETAASSLARAKLAGAAGATAVMAHPPRGETLDATAAAEYYATLGSTGLRIWVQDAPGFISTELDLESYVAIASSVPSVIGFKVETSAPIERIHQAREALGSRYRVFGGGGGRTFPEELSAGADGTMPGVTGCEVFVEEWAASVTVGVEGAVAIHSQYGQLWQFLDQYNDAFVHAQKLFLVDRGIFRSANCRNTKAVLTGDDRERWLSLTASFK